MDGFKKRVRESLQLRLSLALVLTILLTALGAAAFSFASAWGDAHEMQDDTLRQVAALLERQQLALAAAQPTSGDDSDQDSRLVVQYLSPPHSRWDANDKAALLPLPVDLPDGLHTLATPTERFRVLVRSAPDGRKIAVAQATGARDEIAQNSALRAVVPFLVLVPILMGIVAGLVRRIFRPIAALSSDVDRRAEEELHPVDPNQVPLEVRPFVVAINRLLGRVEQSMEGQRRFVADAAHELRSPLTALSLQAERLSLTELPPLARERVATLRQGIDRGQRLLEQLLTLARAESAIDRPVTLVSVQQVYRRVLEDFIPLAQARQIDIGVEGALDVTVRVNEPDLMVIVKNLVDNAIRYTPAKGRVDLSVTVAQGRTVLTIEDTGPGIQIEERVRVFDAFYRTLGSEQAGSGLGLSIVSTIATRMGAAIEMDFADQRQRSGLRIQVVFPAGLDSRAMPAAATVAKDTATSQGAAL